VDRVRQGLIGDHHIVMFFQKRPDGPHHDHGLGLIGFFNFDDLKAPGHGGVLFKVLLVFGPGGGGDGSQFSTGQRGFEQVGRIPGTGLTAGADQCVGLVDEQDDRNRGGLDVADHPFETVFKLTLDAGSGLEQAQVEGVKGHVLQYGRDISLGDAQGESFDHGGLADPGFTGENGIVLPSPDENIHHLADFQITAQHRVDFTLFGPFGEVDGKLIQCLGARLNSRFAPEYDPQCPVQRQPPHPHQSRR
jgi:hypothetical protein